MIERYTPSSARLEFGRSIVEISTTMKRIAPPKRVDADLKNFVLGASILFLNAKLENYISDLFTSMCQEACGSIRTASGIPAALLGWMFLNDGHHERSRSFVAHNDEGEFIKNTGDYLAKELIANGEAYLTPKRFGNIADKAYPSAKNVKRMYKRIGIESIFKMLNRRLRRNVENDLTSLNSLRGSLAHSGISGALSYGDVRIQLRSIVRFVEALDKETYYYLRDVGAVSAWKR